MQSLHNPYTPKSVYEIFLLQPGKPNRLLICIFLICFPYLRKCGTTAGDVWTTSAWGEQNLMLLIFDSVYGKNHPADKGFSLRANTVHKGTL